MLFSIFAIFSYITCAIVAAPIPIGEVSLDLRVRGYNDDIELNARNYGDNVFGLIARGPVAKSPAAVPAKAPAACPTKAKRATLGPVATAWKARDKKGMSVPGSKHAGVFSTKFNGQPAVIKVLETWQNTVEREVQHLIAVEQYLGWGRVPNNGPVYIVIKYMGKPREAAGITVEEARALNQAADAHYAQQYRMRAKDKNSDNYVYTGTGADRRAEIVDWDRAETTDGRTLPAPPAAEPLTDESMASTACCGINCTIM
ncbi:hypothetical protein C8J56DRAFT_891699 [Mycena floridula]|nr:hypothetical protein C8J56DRAFT_891699 [Mycena floridula]